MFELPTTKERLSSLFCYLAYCYDGKRLPHLETVYQFILKEGKETYSYYISIVNGRAQSVEGQHASPALTIRSSVSDWFDLSSRKLNAYWGFLTRRYCVEGSLFRLQQMRTVFGKRFDKTDIPEMRDEIEDFEIPRKRIWKKPKKVLVINASPHRKDGFTYFYLRYLIKGMRKTGTEVELIDIYDEAIKIDSCRGCRTCWFKPASPCVINDDARALLEKVDRAHLTLYAFPLYANSVPDKLRTFLIRFNGLFLPYMMPYRRLTRHPRRNRREQYMSIFAICGFPEMQHFKPSVETFQLDAVCSHRPLIATILCPGAEDLYLNPSSRRPLEKVLNALQRAGKELIEEGRVSKVTLKTISKIYVSPKSWRRGLNLYWSLKQKQGS